MYILEHPICVLFSFLIFYFFLILSVSFCLLVFRSFSTSFCSYFTASLATLSSFCGSSVSLDRIQRLLPSTFLSLHCIPFCSTRYLFHPFSVFSLALFFPFSLSVLLFSIHGIFFTSQFSFLTSSFPFVQSYILFLFCLCTLIYSISY